MIVAISNNVCESNLVNFIFMKLFNTPSHIKEKTYCYYYYFPSNLFLSYVSESNGPNNICIRYFIIKIYKLDSNPKLICNNAGCVSALFTPIILFVIHVL